MLPGESLTRPLSSSRSPAVLTLCLRFAAASVLGGTPGRPLEELGIVPDQRHYMTRKDVLGSNEDLIRRAASILINKPLYSLSVKPFKRDDGIRGIVVSAESKIKPPASEKNISRLDVYLNGRPYRSLDATNGAIESKRLTLYDSTKGKIGLVLEARDGRNQLVASYRRTF